MFSNERISAISSYIDKNIERSEEVDLCDIPFGLEYDEQQENEAKRKLESDTVYLKELIFCEQKDKSDKHSFENMVDEKLEESFSVALRRIIREKGKAPTDVYKKAFIDRKLYSKIQNDKSYKPSKKTAVAFALALELDLDDTKDLLNKAGYSLSRSQEFDLIIEWHIDNKIYSIIDINHALLHFNQPAL